MEKSVVYIEALRSVQVDGDHICVAVVMHNS